MEMWNMKVFYPRKYIDVKASSPHPENTYYRVAFGEEEWDSKFVQVIKVQMVYDGKIAGRKSPSYPVGTDDHKRVLSAIEKLESELAQLSRNYVYIPAKDIKTIPFSRYIALVKKIPVGKIVTSEDIDKYFKNAYKVDSFRFNSEAISPSFDEEGNEIPYWRVVGKGGRVTVGGRYELSRETKIKKLNDEGIETEEFSNDLVRVREYRRYVFSLNQINSEDILSTPDTDETPAQRFVNLLKKEKSFKGLPDSFLRLFVNNGGNEKTNDKDTKGLLEIAKEELEKRKQ